MHTLRHLLGPAYGALLTLGLLSYGPPAAAAAPWVDRPLTLPRHDWAFDVGLGVAHTPETLSPGFNAELAVGLSSRLQLGVRMGIRVSDEARETTADAYGRMFDTETYGTGNSVLANPEVSLRGALVSGDVIEVGLEGRVELPFSRGVGMLVGVPLALHIGRVARLDTGVYVPILFYDPTVTAVSIPLHLWLQATDRFWIGPMSGIVVESAPSSRTRVPFGVGLGYGATRALDFKAQLLFRDVNHAPREDWGFGVGIQVRVE
jgi:hypothetical protein